MYHKERMLYESNWSYIQEIKVKIFSYSLLFFLRYDLIFVMGAQKLFCEFFWWKKNPLSLHLSSSLVRRRGSFLVPSFTNCWVYILPSRSESLSFIHPSFATPAKHKYIARSLTYKILSETNKQTNKILSALYRIFHSFIKNSSS